MQRAKLARRDDRPRDAKRDLDLALSTWPQYEEALLERIRVNSDLEQHEAAIVDLIVARRLEPTNPKLIEYAAWLINWAGMQGRRLHDEGKTDEARSLLELAMQLDPEHSWLMMVMARLQSDSELIQQQEQAEANPKDFVIHRRLDYALASRGRYADVVTMWDAFIVLMPSEGRAHFERGGAHHHLGSAVQAKADLVTACELGVEEGCRTLKRFAPGQ